MLTSSQSKPDYLHTVIVTPQRLAYDCPWGQYHSEPTKPCAHRKLVHERLVRERDAAAKMLASQSKVQKAA